MSNAAEALVEVWRGPILEGVHYGHAAVWHAKAGLIASWGDPNLTVLPRSSCKMIQALPLVESGAAEARHLTQAQLALACASHSGQPVHTQMVEAWLADLGMSDSHLRCGAHIPSHVGTRDAMIAAHEDPLQRHNNCSGKHSGFLTLGAHLGAGPEYLEIDHPVQRAVHAATEEVCGAPTRGHAIDGCSAPNFAVGLAELARGMANFAAAGEGDVRGRAMIRLREAMMARPDLVSGDGRACKELMEAMAGRAAIKTGAEAVFVGIVPEHEIGIAVKISDGTTRASEAVIAQLLSGLGVLDAAHPAAKQRTFGPIRNWKGTEVGHVRPVQGLTDWRL